MLEGDDSSLVRFLKRGQEVLLFLARGEVYKAGRSYLHGTGHGLDISCVSMKVLRV